LWIHQCQVYRSLLRRHAGKIHNRGNLKRTAQRCWINGHFFLSVEELKLRLGICKQKCNYFRKHGKRHCQQHLDQCLEAAKDRADDDNEQKILAIIRWGKDCSFWQRLNFALGKHIQGQSIREVQVEDGNGGILEFDTQEGVQNAIFNKVHQKWYSLVEEAPICKGSLRRHFGYMSTLPTAWSVLDGSYDFPTDIDEALKELFDKCAKIRSIVPANLVTGIISPKNAGSNNEKR
jgi:hypothetical protein